MVLDFTVAFNDKQEQRDKPKRRFALGEGEGGSVGNSYIGTVQIGSISKAYFFLDGCLLLLGTVL